MKKAGHSHKYCSDSCGKDQRAAAKVTLVNRSIFCSGEGTSWPQMKRNHYKRTRQTTGVVPKCSSFSSTLDQKTAPESNGKLLTFKKQKKLRHLSTGCWQLWWKPQTDNKNDVSGYNKPASNYGHCLFFFCHGTPTSSSFVRKPSSIISRKHQIFVSPCSNTT